MPGLTMPTAAAPLASPLAVPQANAANLPWLNNALSNVAGLRGASPSGSGNGLSDLMSQMQLANTDYQNAMTVAQQMDASNKVNETQRWQIQQDTETKGNEILQSSSTNLAQTASKMTKKFDEQIQQA
jgi:hypothetical protein